MEGNKYFLIVVVPLFILVVVLLGLSFYLQPFTGDLTRIGGFTENGFGWNEPQFGFKDRGTSYASISENGKEEDYVVYGDSFSHWCAGGPVTSEPSGCFQWTAFFKNRTGLQGLTYHQDHYGIDEFIASIRRLDTKPKFIIYQSVERYAVPRLMSVAEGNECVTSVPSGIAQLTYNKATEPAVVIDRLKSTIPFDMNIPSAYLKQLVASVRKPRVLKANLVEGEKLFSNNKSTELLYHREDLNKMRYSAENYEAAKCGMNVFAAKAQLELGLPTFFLIAPDKSSVYGPWFEDQAIRTRSIVPELVDPNVNFVDLLSPMSAAVNNNVIDLYLPNDTHWGARGGELAARILADAIKKKVLAFD
ncbi:alginate O-acetyltransferase AlgX-related protein [Alkalimarinus coralli]|uniref:alginate O-acetyltransferase AlgX-related protein n=1 Tax=Alkalimarinus coralli TaxID=2935863 RepID=UPI00202B7F91|nr:hypothetical protein [Alkalimarinus coralli]